MSSAVSIWSSDVIGISCKFFMFFIFRSYKELKSRDGNIQDHWIASISSKFHFRLVTIYVEDGKCHIYSILMHKFLHVVDIKNHKFEFYFYRCSTSLRYISEIISTVFDFVKLYQQQQQYWEVMKLNELRFLCSQHVCARRDWCANDFYVARVCSSDSKYICITWTFSYAHDCILIEWCLHNKFLCSRGEMQFDLIYLWKDSF